MSSYVSCPRCGELVFGPSLDGHLVNHETGLVAKVNLTAQSLGYTIPISLTIVEELPDRAGLTTIEYHNALVERIHESMLASMAKAFDAYLEREPFAG